MGTKDWGMDDWERAEEAELQGSPSDETPFDRIMNKVAVACIVLLPVIYLLAVYHLPRMTPAY